MEKDRLVEEMVNWNKSILEKIKYILLLIFLAKLPLVALSTSIDSTYIYVLNLPNDSLKVSELNNLSYQYLKINTDTSLYLSRSALDISLDLNNKFLLASSYNQLGLTYKYKAQYDSAIVNYKRSLEIFSDLRVPSDAARVLNRMGNVYKRFGDFQKAIESFQKSMHFFEQANDNVKVGWVLNNLGALYYDMGYYDDAINFYTKNLDLRKKTNNNYGIHTVYMNIGNAYAAKLDYNNGLIYYKLALDNLSNKRNKYDRMLLVHNIGSCYESLGRLSDAKSMFLQAIEMQKSLGEKELLVFSLQGVGNILIKNGNYTSGIKYLKEAFQLALEIKDIRKQHKLSKNLYIAYEDIQDYKQSMHYLKAFVAIEDSIYNLDKKQIVLEQEQKYKAREREQQIAFLEKEKEIQELELQKKEYEASLKNKQRNLLAIIVFLTLVILGFILRESAKRKKRNILLVKQNQKIVDQRSEIVKRNQELLESNKTKDKLFQIIAHDLRSPLISIDSLTQLVPFWVEEQDYDSLQKLAKTMEVSINNVLSLIDNLLNWALSQQGKFPYNPENFKIVNTLEEAVKIYYPVAELKNIDIKIKVPHDTLVFADRNMFLTIIRNLLNNAIKFTPESGNIEVGIEYHQSLAKIWVKDSGVGIPEDKQEEIFELTTGGEEGTKGESGKGLGLFFCKEFANINNGDVYLDTKYKKGTKITFTIPLFNTSVN